MFTVHEVRTEEVLQFINHPINAINMEHGAHISMNQNFAWGVEAIWLNNRARIITSYAVRILIWL
jgi:hypothetical protein